MVHQLILNTLMACQPKVPAETSAVVDAKQVSGSTGSSDVVEVSQSTDLEIHHSHRHYRIRLV